MHKEKGVETKKSEDGYFYGLFLFAKHHIHGISECATHAGHT
jgi:hypothetical protein